MEHDNKTPQRSDQQQQQISFGKKEAFLRARERSSPALIPVGANLYFAAMRYFLPRG